MNELGKGNVRRLLQESLYGEIEEYMQACRGIRCPEGWRDEIRDITRRVLELLFYYDEAEITGVEQWGNRLCFTYILRGYGVGETAQVEYESDLGYLRSRFALLRDGHVRSTVTYQREEDEISLSYRRPNGEYVTVMG